MSDLLGKGAAWLEKTRRKYMSTPISYRRGSSSITIPATRGRSISASDGNGGYYVESRSEDWLIQVSDLAIDDIPVEPAIGDLIVDTNAGGKQFTFEVMTPEGGRHWDWSDQYHITYRIHTKYTGTTQTGPR